MKKNDGYVLPFVLVVILVLSLVATTLMGTALRNFTAQQESIARMQDRYAAQGEIEKIVALIEKTGGEYVPASESGVTIEVVNTTVTEGDKEVEKEYLVVRKGSVEISCELDADLTDCGDNKISFEKKANVTYKSYTITTVTSDEGGDSE